MQGEVHSTWKEQQKNQTNIDKHMCITAYIQLQLFTCKYFFRENQKSVMENLSAAFSVFVCDCKRMIDLGSG